MKHIHHVNPTDRNVLKIDTDDDQFIYDLREQDVDLITIQLPITVGSIGNMVVYVEISNNGIDFSNFPDGLETIASVNVEGPFRVTGVPWLRIRIDTVGTASARVEPFVWGTKES